MDNTLRDLPTSFAGSVSPSIMGRGRLQKRLQEIGRGYLELDREVVAKRWRYRLQGCKALNSRSCPVTSPFPVGPAVQWSGLAPPDTYTILCVGPAVNRPRPRCLTESNTCAIMRVAAAHSMLKRGPFPSHHRARDDHPEKNHPQNKYRYTSGERYVHSAEGPLLAWPHPRPKKDGSTLNKALPSETSRLRDLDSNQERRFQRPLFCR
jgi:hypothetical protein